MRTGVVGAIQGRRVAPAATVVLHVRHTHWVRHDLRHRQNAPRQRRQRAQPCGWRKSSERRTRVREITTQNGCAALPVVPPCTRQLPLERSTPPGGSGRGTGERSVRSVRGTRPLTPAIVAGSVRVHGCAVHSLACARPRCACPLQRVVHFKTRCAGSPPQSWDGAPRRATRQRSTWRLWTRPRWRRSFRRCRHRYLLDQRGCNDAAAMT